MIPSKPNPATSAALKRPAVWNEAPLPYVARIIAVASGKGGVGKSTMTLALARALSAGGARVGILDADLYGPSLPQMLGITGKPEFESGQMLPLEKEGILCMSMEFIVGEQAAVLRGPMISKALQQMLRLTRWGTQDTPLDVLLVDMPPGTGDIHLSLAQQAPLSGAIIVTTPQTVAIKDARKCAEMFGKVNVPLLGVIENMGGGVFGSGGGARLAQEFNMPLLGSVALDARLCQASEEGTPYLPEAMEGIAKRVKEALVVRYENSLG